MSRRSGMTLMEVLIAVSLLSLLSVGMLMAMRIGLNALGKANSRLIENRRVAGVERILENQIGGLIPVTAKCAATPQSPGVPMLFFQGEPQSMRFVSSYSLAEAWRGMAMILEYQVIPGENGEGVRLVVNEIPYTGPLTAGQLCLGRAPVPALGGMVPRFLPIQTGPASFVLADKLSLCRFFYQGPPAPGAPPTAPDLWRPGWMMDEWPRAIRIELAPLEDNPARLRPVTVTAPIRIRRSQDIQYGDY